jgi:ABC-type multidrug transport system ATPase subunit
MTSFSVISENLSKKYSGKTIFTGLNFRLNKGESAVITGRNGSGKSTLMKIISGLISPSSGKMKFIKNDEELEREFIRTNIGFVSPYLNLYDELTALENLRLFSGLKSSSRNYDDEKLNSYLQLVGLYNRRHDEIKAYSSGMKQKLKIAFSLLHEPAVLLMDEPRSNLDRDGISIIENIALKQKENGILIIATNDEDDLKLCDLKINIEDHKK